MSKTIINEKKSLFVRSLITRHDREREKKKYLMLIGFFLGCDDILV
jgi:hypothetical protein